ncbi:MAG: DUF5689 domain-containing protein [Sphingobacterium sp.]
MNRNIMLLTLFVFTLFASCKKTEGPDLRPLFLGTKNITLRELKAWSTKTEIILPAGDEGLQINGVIISDFTTKNIDAKTIVLQSEETANNTGIIIQFDSVPSFKLGERLIVNLAGQKLVRRNGELALVDVPLSNAKSNGTGYVNIRTTTIDSLLKHADLWNGTLIRLYDGALSGGNGKYNATLSFKETGESALIKSRILQGALFENTTYPTAINEIIGILRTNGTEHFIDIRSTQDVVSSLVTRVVTDDMQVIGIANDPYSTQWSDPTLFSTDMETAVSKYGVGFINGYHHPKAMDMDFLQKDRSYFYFYTMAGPYESFVSNALTLPNAYALQSVKEIRITFAGSKANGLIATSANGDSIIVKPFQPGKDIFKLGLEFSNNGYPIDNTPLLESGSFTQIGRFLTATFTIPKRSEILKYMPTDASMAANFISVIDEWLMHPGFKVKNLSTRVSADPNSFSEPYAPLVISKIEYAF